MVYHTTKLYIERVSIACGPFLKYSRCSRQYSVCTVVDSGSVLVAEGAEQLTVMNRLFCLFTCAQVSVVLLFMIAKGFSRISIVCRCFFDALRQSTDVRRQAS
jgi:hypothetical protein